MTALFSSKRSAVGAEAGVRSRGKRGEKKRRGKKQRHKEAVSMGAELFSPGLTATSKAGTPDQYYSGPPLSFFLLFWLMLFSVRAQTSWLAAGQEHVPGGLGSCVSCGGWEARPEGTVKARGQQGSVAEPMGRHKLFPLSSDWLE